MLLWKAMRYYRLWIYTCNSVLLLGVLVFCAAAGCVLTDARSRFVPVPLYHPTFLYAYAALAAQGGLLQAVGCYGALRLNEKWLNVYWLAMLLLLLGDVLVGVVWIFLFSSLTHSLPAQLWQHLQRDYGRDAAYTQAWDDLQRQLRCCGVHGPRDYNASAVPPSCSLYRARTATVDLNATSLVNLTRAPYSSSSSTTTASRASPPKTFSKTSPLTRVPPPPPPLSSSVTTAIPVQSSQNAGGNGGATTASQKKKDEEEEEEEENDGRIARQGCARPLQDWMQHCADVLFVLGYCVIAFLKLCFLGILRYEIKEMIQKIKILQSDMPPFPELVALGLHSPSSEHKNYLAELTSSHSNHLNSLLMSGGDPAANHLLGKKSRHSNGNNNDLELTELTRDLS